MKKKPTSRKPRSARSATGTGRPNSGSHRQTATASSRSSRPATISLEETLEMMDEQAAEAAYMNDVTQKIRESASSSTPPDSFHRAGSETGQTTSAESPAQTQTPYDTAAATEDIQRARGRLVVARHEHQAALVVYHALRPTQPQFPDAAQVLYLAGLELVKAAGDLYYTVKEI